MVIGQLMEAASEALRNIRHHAVRSMLAEALKEVGFTVHQEVQGLATQGSVRRIDIIAIKNNSAYILDPTIRFETHADHPHEVDSEKKRIYESTIPFYKDKYSLSHIDVIGLMVGARGTLLLCQHIEARWNREQRRDVVVLSEAKLEDVELKDDRRVRNAEKGTKYRDDDDDDDDDDNNNNNT
ncbi:hypothetical protein ANN_21962 [Periplaneta americana]|uniref:Uncharacterized protein n=1 Tax=Periplaneta americana TaxID=6978 RepID=A0ABQ8S739_PERAM|nr:hypothetical protein ANN_21962 [Periplaneta americana]